MLKQALLGSSAQRRFERFKVLWRIPIHAMKLDGLWATVEEIGPGGVRVAMRHRLTVGDRLTFGLDEDASGKPLIAEVRNVYERGDGLFVAGLAWKSMTHALARQLTRHAQACAA